MPSDLYQIPLQSAHTAPTSWWPIDRRDHGEQCGFSPQDRREWPDQRPSSSTAVGPATRPDCEDIDHALRVSTSKDHSPLPHA